jgi:hypothetical protein
LYVLALVIMVSTSVVLVYGKVGQLRSLKEKIKTLETQMNRLQGRLPDESDLRSRKEHLIGAISLEERKYYAKKEIDPYRFSIAVRKTLLANNLEIQKFQTIDVKDRVFLEFSLSGSAYSLANFLKTASNTEKYWYIPFLSIDAQRGDGRISAVLRLHYETLDDSDR